MKIHLEDLINYLVLIVVILFILLSPNISSVLQVSGILCIIINLYLAFRCRNNKLLLLLFSLIAFTNLSLSYTDAINLGKGVSLWQSNGLRKDVINNIVMKSILLNTTVLNTLLSRNLLNKISKQTFLDRKKNSLISISGIIILYLILIYGFASIKSSIGNYVSVDSPIYEYSLIIYCLVWFYSKDMKLIDYLIYLYSFVFFSYFLIIGDRSSVFMLAIIFLILYLYDYIKLKFISLFVLIGIPIVNIFGVLRSSGLLNLNNIIQLTLEKGFYVDTVSWAYYTSLALAKLHYRVEQPFEIAIGFFSGVLGFKNEFYFLGSYAKDNFSDLYNAGGGIYPSYFFAMGGYTGVILGAVLLFFIIKYIMSFNNIEFLPYKILLVTFAFRWYVYSPATLLRGVLILSSFAIIACYLFDKLTKRKNE